MLSLRSRHAREIYFCLLRSVGAKNYGFVSSDARKEADEKILPQGVYGRARPGRRAQPLPYKKELYEGQKTAFLDAISEHLLLIIKFSHLFRAYPDIEHIASYISLQPYTRYIV